MIYGILILPILYALYVLCARLEFVAGYVTLLIGIFIFWAIVAAYALRKKTDTPVKIPYFFLCAVAVVIRLLFFSLEPGIISSDAYRYLYDGKMSAHHINPYQYKPADDAVSFLRYTDTARKNVDSLYGHMQHKEFKTIYPPVSQYIFHAAYALGVGKFWPLRTLYLILEAIFLISLIGFSGDLRRSKTLVLAFWAFNPYIIFETYLAMHIDFVSMFFLWFGFVFFLRNRLLAFTVALAAAVLTKFIAAVALPAFVFVYLRNNFQARAVFRAAATLFLLSGLFFAIVLTAYLPFSQKGVNLFEQLTIFAEYWRFNSSAHDLIGSVIHPAYMHLAKALVLTAVFAMLWKVRAGLITLIKTLTLTVFFISPVYYPWYNVTLLPLFYLRPNVADSFLLALLPASYFILYDYNTAGIWRESLTLKLVIFAPLFMSYSIAAFRRYVQK